MLDVRKTKWKFNYEKICVCRLIFVKADSKRLVTVSFTFLLAQHFYLGWRKLRKFHPITPLARFTSEHMSASCCQKCRRRNMCNQFQFNVAKWLLDYNKYPSATNWIRDVMWSDARLQHQFFFALKCESSELYCCCSKLHLFA